MEDEGTALVSAQFDVALKEPVSSVKAVPVRISPLSHAEHPLAQNLPCTTEGDTTPVRCSSAPCLCLK